MDDDGDRSHRAGAGTLPNTRRELLQYAGIASATAAAGCLSEDGSTPASPTAVDDGTPAGSSGDGFSEAEKQELEASFGPGTNLKRYLDSAIEDYKAGATERAAYRFELVRSGIASAVDADGDHEFDGLAGQLNMTNFFTQGRFFQLFHLVDTDDSLEVNDRDSVRRIAEEYLETEGIERGPNNRPFYYGLGRAGAWAGFPESESADKWKDAAEAIFHDWFDPGDTYEPGYVPHNIEEVIELGQILGKEEELQSEKIRSTYYRYRDHVSPSGLAVTHGDGFAYRHPAYASALKRMASITEDPTLLWTAQKARLAGSSPATYPTPEDIGRVPEDQREDVLEAEFEEFRERGIEPKRPEQGPSIQYLHPETHENPIDRMLLAPSREEGQPYAGFYLNDMAETLHHAHEDNRGDLYHWEVDGNLLMFHQGWVKPVSLHNTLVMADPTEEFPYRQTDGVEPGYWHRASANTQLMRHYTPTDNYPIAGTPFAHGPRERIHPRNSYPVTFKDQDRPSGTAIQNPEVYTGKCDQQDVEAVTLRFATFPDGKGGSFTKNVGWYKDWRASAPADGPVDVLLRDLRLAGPAGTKTLDTLDDMPEDLEVIFEPPSGEDAPENPDDPMLQARERRLDSAEVEEILEVVPDPENPDRTALKLTCRPGRTDLVLNGVDIEFDAAEEYRRIEMDYYYGDGASEFIRPPIRIVPRSHGHDNCCRSMYVDRVQGGTHTGSTVDQAGDDTYGRVEYTGIFTHDTDWTRRTILTAEGYLLVEDVLEPGDTAEGMVGGPVWNLHNPPEQGMNWFDADATHPEWPRGNGQKAANYLPAGEVNVLAYFGNETGHQYGVQYQGFKSFGLDSYAVNAKTTLHAGDTESFLTVLAPHDPGMDPKSVAEDVSVDTNTRQIDIAIGEDDLTVAFGDGDQWSVSR